MAWTAPTTRATGYVVLASDWNADLVNNLLYLHGDSGSVDLSASSATYTQRALILSGSAVGNSALQAKITTDTQPRAQFSAGGVLSLGPGGSTVVDTIMGRTSAGVFAMTQGNGIGYAIGTGGSATQATSKSTGVTVDAACGRITMNGAALAAGASVSFTVSNSLLGTSDLVILTIGNNLTNSYANYRVDPPWLQGASPSPSGFNVRLTNISGGSLSEAVIINFAIIKGASN